MCVAALIAYNYIRFVAEREKHDILRKLRGNSYQPPRVVTHLLTFLYSANGNGNKSLRFAAGFRRKTEKYSSARNTYSYSLSFMTICNVPHRLSVVQINKWNKRARISPNHLIIIFLR